MYVYSSVHTVKQTPLPGQHLDMMVKGLQLQTLTGEACARKSSPTSNGLSSLSPKDQ